VRVIAQPGLRVLFLCLRPDRPPFDDPRVREALDLAIDRGELVQRALAGRAQVVSQVVPPAVVGHDPALHLPAPDRDRARKLLAEAGHAGGLTLRLDGPSNRYQNDRKILAEVARQLGEVGVRTEVRALEKGAFFPLIESGASSFYLLGWACESGDAGDVLGSLLHSPGTGALGAYNTLGLADAELDRLIDESDRASSGSERADRLRQAVARVARLRVVLPLVIQTDAVLLSRRVGWDAPFNLALRPEQMRPER